VRKPPGGGLGPRAQGVFTRLLIIKHHCSYIEIATPVTTVVTASQHKNVGGTRHKKVCRTGRKALRLVFPQGWVWPPLVYMVYMWFTWLGITVGMALARWGDGGYMSRLRLYVT